MRLDVPDLTFVPVSALHGDNIVERSPNMAWYDGASLLHHLEEVHIASDRNLTDPRFPVQWVVRPRGDEHHDYRGYAGTVAGGVIKPGDEVVVLPSGFTSTVDAIDAPAGLVEEAFAPMAVTVRLDDDLDISRGDMLCRPNNRPIATQDLDATICWMDGSSELRPGRKLAIKHTTRWARAMVADLVYRLDVNTLHRDSGTPALSLNEIGRVRLRCTRPLFVDDYRRNRITGSFMLVDEDTNATVAAGMVRAAGG
jgi:bifunctional enzyme CysN/CysC